MFRIDVIHKVEQYVATHQDQVKAGSWIEGMGWDQNIWDDKVFPSAVSPVVDGLHRYQANANHPVQADLEASPDLRGLPISLKRIDIHAEWVSQSILDLMGELPEKVEGGEIIRDESGKPTGVFVSQQIANTFDNLDDTLTNSAYHARPTTPCSL
jgi:predicted amidohydrolase YtcJ